MIFNAKDRPLNQNSGTLPDVSGAMLNWFQPITFSQVVKTVGQNSQVKETKTDVVYQGVWQPFSPRQLMMKPEKQRDWSWYTLHAQPGTGVDLIPDDVVTYLGKQYRVMENLDYKLYGYIEYHLVEDYTGSGPE